MRAPAFDRAFLHPRCWGTWLALGLLRLIVALPIPLALKVGEGLGALTGRVLGGRRRVVAGNIRLCFPDLDAREQAALVRAHFRALGAGIVEAGLAWWASDARLAPRVEVRGIEHLDAAMADGSGVLLLTGHFTTLELGARLMAMQRPFHPMYRPINNRLLDWLMHRWRSRRARLDAVPRDDLRGLVKALRAGRGIWYAPDQTLDRRASVWAPFFGVPAQTITATAKLAQLGRAKVVPYFPSREGGRYVLTVQPALADFPSGDDVADAARINALVEAGIRAAPAQYFWVHKRFKHRPEGMADPYARGAAEVASGTPPPRA